ncbi:MAG: signal peptidase I [Acidimicrobiales bacterium]
MSDPAGPTPHSTPFGAPPAPDLGTDRSIELPSEEHTSVKSSLASWGITIGIAVVLTLLVKAFVLQAYSIPSPSMLPTLHLGDRVVVFQLNTDPARGDIIVFDRPPNDPKTSPDDPDVLIKRVIGLPGETVEARNGHVYVDGKKLEEDYLPDSTSTVIASPIEVPSGKLLVMGDNRGDSMDGRVFGPISKDLIVGRAIARIWPPSRIGGL